MTNIAKVRIVISCLGLLTVLAGSLLLIRPMMTTPTISDAFRKSSVQDYGKLPLAFEANVGQADADVSFISRGRGYSLLVTRSAETVLVLGKSPGRTHVAEQLNAIVRRPATPAGRTTEVLRFKLVDSVSEPSIEGGDPLGGKASYLIGRDPRQWHTNVPLYGKVRIRSVYPGIDMVYYGNQGRLEEDFVVAPGSDPKRIGWIAEGAQRLSVDDSGDLLVTMKAGVVHLGRPVSYQEVGGVRREIPTHYVLLSASQVGVELGSYDRAHALVIDPPLSYSTYLGGGTDDFAHGIAVDSAGNAYVVGETTSINFPNASGVSQALGGSRDVFVTKLNSSGTGLVYSTYLGGSGEDVGNAIAVDATGNAYITGITQSGDFPVTSGVFQPALAGTKDAFVTKLDSTGSTIAYSSYLGGAANQDVFNTPLQGGFGIKVDSQGNAYVAGETDATDFPVTAGAYQTTYGSLFSGVANAFVTKVNPTGSALVYSTYVGGTAAQGFAIAIDSSGNAYITGLTECCFPTTAGAYQTTFGGAYSDAFVAKLNASGSALVYSTYVGGALQDEAHAIAIDSSGNAYITGITLGSFPLTAGAFQSTVTGFDTSFVTELNAAGTALVYSTYLGGSAHAQGAAIAVDGSGNAHVAGFTDSPDFPVTSPAQQSTFGGGSGDAYLTTLNPAGTGLVYSTFFGGSDNDAAGGIALDANANDYITGYTLSSNFPVTSGAFQTTLGGNYDSFVAKFGSSSCTPSSKDDVEGDGHEKDARGNTDHFHVCKSSGDLDFDDNSGNGNHMKGTIKRVLISGNTALLVGTGTLGNGTTVVYTAIAVGNGSTPSADDFGIAWLTSTGKLYSSAGRLVDGTLVVTN